MTYPSARSVGGGAAAFHVGAGRVPNPQGPPPPLPNGIAFSTALTQGQRDDSTADSARTLRGGCYLMRYTPLQTSPTQPGSIYYLGTLRVQAVGPTITVSGDLYLHRVPGAPLGGQSTEPDPGNGIPVFSRSDYRYYLRATRVSTGVGGGRGVTLGIQLFRFNSAVATWSNDGEFDLQLSWTTTPPGFPSEADYLTGEMRNTGGTVSGTVTLGWLSSHLRRAVVEIDRVRDGVTPRENGSGLGWKEVFAPVGWDVTVIESDTNVPEPSGEFWNYGELHDAMLRFRDRRSSLLDQEWRYHILCVRRIDDVERGVMYDASATDSNNTPREGLCIACNWVYETRPNSTDPDWGELLGVRFGSDEATYFRTAIHELGHALGLYHNTADNGFMNTTDTIAKRARPERPFPGNIRWGFHPDDEKRLRHMPDLWVRPGGIQFGEDYSVAPIATDDMIQRPEGLELQVSTAQKALPLGAPARIEFTLTNRSAAAVTVPGNLTLRGGSVRGKVIDPAGTVRSFLPLVQCVESQAMSRLDPGESLASAVTILRGPQGALFPGSGLYRVIVEIQWDDPGGRQGLVGATDILIGASETPDHAEAAHRVLSTPDALLTIASSSAVEDGVNAIETAAADPTLAPYYAWLSAKRLLMNKHNDAALRQALQLMTQVELVMSPVERQKAVKEITRLREDRAVSHTRTDSGVAGGRSDLMDLARSAAERLERGH